MDTLFERLSAKAPTLDMENGDLEHVFKQLPAELREFIRALQSRELLLRAAFEQLQLGVAHASLTGKLISVNSSFAKMLGYSVEELKGKSFHSITHPEDLENDICHIQQLMAGEIEEYRIEKRYLRKDKSIVWAKLSVSLVRSAEDEPLYAVGIVENISEKKSDRIASAVLRSSMDGFFIVDEDARIVEVNEAYCSLMGYSRQELSGKHVYDLKKGATRESVLAEIARVRELGTARWETQHLRKDGSLVDFEVKAEYLDIDGGRFSAFFRDITEAKQQQRARDDYLVLLRRRQREAEAFFQGTRAVLEMKNFTDTAKHLFYSCSKLIGSTSGYTALLSSDGTENEVLFLEAGGLPCTVDPELPMPIRGLRAESYFSGEVVYDNDFMNSEWVKFMPHGHVELKNVMFSPLVINGNVVGIMGLANKPTDFDDNDARLAKTFGELAAVALHNARTLESIQEREARHRSVVESATDAILLVNKEDMVLFANPASEQVFGYAADELCGMLASEILEDIPGEWHTEDDDASLGAERVELKARTKDNRVLPIDVARACWSTETERFCTLIIRDQSRRKELELQLLSAQKLESIGQLAAGIAHEINTPMQFVGDNVCFLEETFRDLVSLCEKQQKLLEQNGGVSEAGQQAYREFLSEVDLPYLMDELPRAFEQARDGIERVAKIVRSMKEFSHPAAQTKTPSDLNRGIENAVTVSRNEWKYVSDVELELDSSLPLVPCLIDEVNQVVLNLVLNAAHAIEAAGKSDKGIIRISTAKHSGWVEIRVVDNGIGISPNLREKVFDPFYTTKEVGKGTGQGLAIAKSIVMNQHGGEIYCEDAPGGGATFVLRLPLE